jgi:flavodoxin I
MKHIGLFYGESTTKTAAVAKKIQETFGKTQVDLMPIEEAWKKEFQQYDCLIAGAATWFDGELPSYWDEIVPILITLDLKGKKIAIFGLGDQANYPDNFVDSIGLLSQAFHATGAQIVGFTSTKGYQFNHSQALVGNQFSGLVLDQENQSDQTDDRIRNWVKQLKKEFEIK